MHNSGGTVGNGVFHGGPCRGVIRITGARICSSDAAVIQRKPETGSRGTAIVRNRYQATSRDDIGGWKR
jgi:hypothetical protein